MSAPTGPERVPVDNQAFRPLISSITRTMREHRTVPREGQVGMTCRNPLCREPIFLTVGAGADHQSFEIIRTIRVEAGWMAGSEDPEEDAEALAALASLLGLGAAAPEGSRQIRPEAQTSSSSTDPTERMP